MDVSAAHPVEEVRHVLGEGNLLPLDKEDALVLERTRPVGVDLQLAPNVLADHKLLGETLVDEAVQEAALLVRDDQLVPFVLLQSQALQSVVLDELKPVGRQIYRYKAKLIIHLLRLNLPHFAHCGSVFNVQNRTRQYFFNFLLDFFTLSLSDREAPL